MIKILYITGLVDPNRFTLTGPCEYKYYFGLKKYSEKIMSSS